MKELAKLLWLACVVALSVSPSSSDSRNSLAPPPQADPPPAPAPEPKPRTAELLASMATLVGHVPDPELVASWERKIDGGASIDGYIDELLATKRFGKEVVPALVFGAFVNVRNYYAVPSGFVLKQTPEGIFYLREPCSAADAVAVHPWWKLDGEVKVCPDSYRPAKWTLSPSEHAYRSRMTLSCDSQVGSPELESVSLCGCGPNLIRCLRDSTQYDELNKSLMDEVKQTTAYVVDHDMPMSTLFTANATFRDRNAELYYRRQKIGALQLERADRELDDLDDWPADGKWAPRPELKKGQHAGVLTAPEILHWLPDRRQRQRGYYEVMWCAMKNSFGATTKKVLDLNSNGNLAFVHDSWERLAKTELCTNCHARLDYGFQFFLGYPDSRASTYFNPALQSSSKGPLYGRDIDDLRGTGPLTPAGFANLATRQPEFKSCMASHFVNYVLGTRATDDDRKAIETAVAKTEQFRPVMKVALQRYAARWRAEVAPAPAATTVAGEPAGPSIKIAPALRAKLDELCSECHKNAPYTDDPDTHDMAPVDFSPATLPRPLLVDMADRVAFGMMPKDAPLGTAAREELVTMLIDTLWSEPQARTEAQKYYLGRARGLPAQQIDNAIYAIEQAAKAPSGITWGAIERGLWSDQSTTTPGFLALTGLEALRACAAAEKTTGTKLEDCLDRATSLQVLSRWPPTHR
ncbi:MAG TPA: hypothetical protein VFQ53_40755 [Kofleriaceae bacterium]|nr:hypothetical protein [Kofleriaceae bacterium]